MKYKIVLILLSGISLSFIYNIQEQSNILWSPKVKLTWDDFQGEVDSLNEYKAITSTLIKTDVIVYNDNELEYDISCLFEKNKSWVKKKTNSLLKHEQLHFDIAELATRKMRKRFLQHKSLNRDSINLMINKIFQEATLERRKINKDYDKETNHSLIVEKQKEWELKIAKELKALEKYSSTKVVIKREKPVVKTEVKKK